MSTPEFAIVGRIRKPHGIRGEVVVEPVTDAPEAYLASGRRLFVGSADGRPLTTGREAGAPLRTLTVQTARDVGSAWFVKFDVIGDRNEADRWRDRALMVPVEELAPAADDEVYYHDLIGLRVVLADGTTIGTVETLYELPQGLALDVRRAGGEGTVMIPWRPEIVRHVDLDARTLLAELPDGLLD